MFLKLIAAVDRTRGGHPNVPFIYTLPTLTHFLHRAYTNKPKYLSNLSLVSNRIPPQGRLSDFILLYGVTADELDNPSSVWSHLADQTPCNFVSLLSRFPKISLGLTLYEKKNGLLIIAYCGHSPGNSSPPGIVHAIELFYLATKHI